MHGYRSVSVSKYIHICSHDKYVSSRMKPGIHSVSTLEVLAIISFIIGKEADKLFGMEKYYKGILV